MSKKDIKVEMQVIDVLVGACAGLTARKIIKGMSKTFYKRQGAIAKIGTAALGLWAAIDFGVKGGSMFYHIRSGMTKAYREITKEEEKQKTDKYTSFTYRHPENYFVFKSPSAAVDAYAYCVMRISTAGSVMVSELKTYMLDHNMKDSTIIFLDNDDKYGWNQMEDFCIGKHEEEHLFYITKVPPRLLYYEKKEEEQKILSFDLSPEARVSENSIIPSFNLPSEALNAYDFCIKMIHDYGQVTVADLKEFMGIKSDDPNDRLYGWDVTNVFDGLYEEGGKITITQVKPYLLDISKEDMNDGESES